MTAPPGPGSSAVRRGALAVLAVVLGLPGCIGLALGLSPRDWPIPFGLQLHGDFALRTVVYLSGFAVAFGMISLIGLGRSLRPVRARDPGGGAGGALAAPAAAPPAAPAAAPPEEPGDGVFLSEPLYGFLPAAAQHRLARETGYHALLYTKISILLSGIIGVLLTGSWEIVGDADPFPTDAVARIGIGLYLIAESVYRLIRFSRGEPTGTLVGGLIYGALAPLRSRR